MVLTWVFIPFTPAVEQSNVFLNQNMLTATNQPFTKYEIPLHGPSVHKVIRKKKIRKKAIKISQIFSYNNWPTIEASGNNVFFHWKSLISWHWSWSNIQTPVSKPFPRKNCSSSVVGWFGRLLYRQSDSCNVDNFWILASLWKWSRIVLVNLGSKSEIFF